MIKHMEAALCLVIYCLLLGNILTPLGHFVRELYSRYLIKTLHLLYQTEKVN
jgi:hypothetical protein